MARRARQKSIDAAIDEAALACQGIVEERAKDLEGIKIGEFLHRQIKAAPNEILVLAKFVNRRSAGTDRGAELRCHVCEELLSQATVEPLSVRLTRPDGTSYSCVLVTCDDPECQQRLIEKIETEGP